MSDLKEQYQERAEEMAQEMYGCYFYDLPEETRDAIYDEAVTQTVEEICYMDMGDR